MLLDYGLLAKAIKRCKIDKFKSTEKVSHGLYMYHPQPCEILIYISALLYCN